MECWLVARFEKDSLGMIFYARENQLLSEHLTDVSVLAHLFAGNR
jgi:hypothetical protein